MTDEGHMEEPDWASAARVTERFTVPHRGGAMMKVGEPICIGGDKPWLCIVKLLAPGASPSLAGEEGEHWSTLLLRSGRGNHPDEARRDALAQLALVYGSPVGPAPQAVISTLDPTPPTPPVAGWLTRLFGRAR